MEIFANLTLTEKDRENLSVFFQYGSRSYEVRLDYRVLQTDPSTSYWDVVIPVHPLQGTVKYILHKDNATWIRFISINRLGDGLEEEALLALLQEVLSAYS